jgi:hypothetical protein
MKQDNPLEEALAEFIQKRHKKSLEQFKCCKSEFLELAGNNPEKAMLHRGSCIVYAQESMGVWARITEICLTEQGVVIADTLRGFVDGLIDRILPDISTSGTPIEGEIKLIKNKARKDIYNELKIFLLKTTN